MTAHAPPRNRARRGPPARIRAGGRTLAPPRCGPLAQTRPHRTPARSKTKPVAAARGICASGNRLQVFQDAAPEVETPPQPPAPAASGGFLASGSPRAGTSRCGLLLKPRLCWPRLTRAGKSAEVSVSGSQTAPLERDPIEHLVALRVSITGHVGAADQVGPRGGPPTLMGPPARAHSERRAIGPYPAISRLEPNLSSGRRGNPFRTRCYFLPTPDRQQPGTRRDHAPATHGRCRARVPASARCR